MEMNKVIVGQNTWKIIDWTWTRTYFARRCSGISKTLAIKHLHKRYMDHSVGYSLHRIYCRQMLGTMIYNIKQNEFS
jgi:hypothetical protein